MKKIIATVLSFILFLNLLSPISVQAKEYNPSLGITSCDAEAGEQLEVNVSIKDNPGILGGTFKVSFDSGLTLKAANAGDAFAALALTKPGKLESGCNFVWDGTDLKDEDIKDGIILKLTFEVDQNANFGDEYNIECSCLDAIDNNLNVVNVDSGKGIVSIPNQVVPPVESKLDYINVGKSKTSYKVGEEISLNDLTVVAFYTDGTSNSVASYTTNLSSIDMSTEGEKNLIVTYTEEGITKTASIKINVTKVEFEDTVTLDVEKVEANPGESVDVNVSIKDNPGILGATLKVVYDSNLKLTAAKSGEAFSALTLTKPGTFASGCNFVWNGTDLSDSDVKDGIVLTLTFKVSEAAKQKDVYDIEVTCIDAIDKNLNAVTVTGAKGSVTVPEKEEPPVEVKLDSITASKTKTSYNVGDELSTDDITVTAYYTDETSSSISTYTTNVSSIDMSTAGEKNLIVSYTEEGITKTASIKINVIKVESEATAALDVEKVEANPGETVDLNVSIKDNPGILGVTLKVVYDSNLKLTAAKSGEAFSALTLTKPGTFASECNFVWDGTDLSDSDIKDGTVLTLTFKISGDAKQKDVYDIEVTCADAIDKNLNAVTVTGAKGSVTVPEKEEPPVEVKLDSITASKTKTSYNVGDVLSTDDITVTVYYTDETSSSISTYTTNVSSIDMSTAGEKNLIVSYTEEGITKTASIKINVIKVESEDTANLDVEKVEANPGEIVDVNVSIKDNPGILGATLKVVYDSNLKLTAAKSGEAFSTLTLTKPGIFASGCNFVWDGTDLSDSVVKDGLVLTLTFKVSEAAKPKDVYDIEVKCEDAIDKNLNAVTVIGAKGSVTVPEKEEPPVEVKLDSITASKTKTSYNVGDVLSTDDITVTAYYTDETSSSITAYTTNASSIDTSTAGEKNLIVSYTEEGITKTASIKINVIKVESEAIAALDVEKVEANPGETVDVKVSIKDNPGILGATLKVVYDSNLKLTAAKSGEAFSALTLTKPGTFASGCNFVWDGTDLQDSDIKDGTVLTLTFKVSEVAKQKDVYDIEVTCTDAIDKNLSAVIVTGEKGSVTIPEKEEPPVEVKLNSITATKIKTSYYVNEVVDTNDITVTAYYTDGTSKTVTDFTTDLFEIDMSTPGDKWFIVFYEDKGIEKTTYIKISVSDNELQTETTLNVGNVEATPETTVDVDVSIKDNPGVLGTTLKVEYDSNLKLISAKSGEAFSALTLTKPGIFESGCNFVWDGTDLADSQIMDGTVLTLTFKVSETAKQKDVYNIEVSCEDAIDKNLSAVTVTGAKGSVTVLEKEEPPVEVKLDSITASKTKTSYNVGEVLSIDDITVTAHYTDESSSYVTTYITNASSIDMSTAGEKNLIVTYKEDITKTASIKINVIATESPVEIYLDSIKAQKTKTSYNIGDVLNTDDITVIAYYTDGTGFNVTEYKIDSSKVNMDESGTKKLIVIYTENEITKTADISIIVNANDTKPTEQPNEQPKEDPKEKPDEPPIVTPKETPGVGTISENGKTLVDPDGVTYLVSDKLKQKDIKMNLQVADKKSGGKYKITKLIKRRGKITGGTVTYMAPYNKNCTKATAGATVKLGGVVFKITAINKNAFKNCKKITNMTIGGNVAQIGANAFNGCISLKRITIKGKGLKKVGSKAFYGINGKATFKLNKSTYNNKKLLKKYTKMIQNGKAPKKSKITK